MLILLPPSEGKADPGSGPPVDLGELAFAESLSERRERLISGLEKLSSRPQKKAIEALGISVGQAGEVARNAELLTAPAAPASAVYSGVLYDRLDFAGLGARATKRAASQVLIASALWGFLRPGDRIPYYRCSMKARLARVGPLAAFWRPALAEAMVAAGFDRSGELILDMRSGAYSAAWKPKQATLLAVRVFTETGGKRKVVSHMAKATRGDAARIVLSAGKLPQDADSVAAALGATGLTVELSDGFLDVILDPDPG
jgi:cytoplasmic iron level regulating protein YaaA (DUF328/UPF0246 family)